MRLGAEEKNEEGIPALLEFVRFLDIEADKFYAVLEGKGIVPFEQIRPTAPSH